jgi:hypothetical protein
MTEVLMSLPGWLAGVYLVGKALSSLWHDRDRPGRGWQ